MSSIVFFPSVETVKIKRREQERESVKGMQCGDQACLQGWSCREGETPALKGALCGSLS